MTGAGEPPEGERAPEGHREAGGPAPAGEARPEPDWQRRRRLAEIFGDALPQTTRDERDPEDATPPRGRGSGAVRGESASDRWWREQVPPHHG